VVEQLVADAQRLARPDVGQVVVAVVQQVEVLARPPIVEQDRGGGVERSELHGLRGPRLVHVGRRLEHAARRKAHLAEALELEELGDGELLVGDPHRLEGLEHRAALGRRERQRQQRRSRQLELDVQAWTDLEHRDLGDTAELAGAAGHQHLLADRAAENPAAVEDEDPLGRRGISVPVDFGCFNEEAAQPLIVGDPGRPARREVASDEAADRDDLAADRRRGAGALHLVDGVRGVARLADAEGENVVGRHRVRRVGDVLVGDARSRHGDRARVAVGEVDVGIEGVGFRSAAHHRGVGAAQAAADGEPVACNVNRLGEADLHIRTWHDTGPAIGRAGRDDGRSVIRRRRGRACLAGEAVAAEPAERVGRVALPLDRRIEGVHTVRVTHLDRGRAAQGVVGRARETRPPLGSRIEADLPHDVEHGRAMPEHHRVVPVEPPGAVRLIGLCEDRRVGAGLREDEHVPDGGSARQADGQPRRSAPVEEHLDVVATGAEVNRRPRAVVDLQRLVVAAPLDVLAEEELCRRRSRRRRRHQRQERAERKGDRDEKRESALHRHREGDGHWERPPICGVAQRRWDRSGSVRRVRWSSEC